MVGPKRNKMVAFVAKAKKMKTHKDRDYFVFRITIPKKEAEVLDLNEEDFLLLYVQKASWYHMINWEEASDTYSLLPENIKEDIKNSQVPVPISPKIELETLKKLSSAPVNKKYIFSLSPSGESEISESA